MAPCRDYLPGSMGSRVARYEILDHDAAFNFAKLNNDSRRALGRDRDLVLFLNNDVELSTPETLQTMAMQLLADRPLAFVGIKLYYPDGKEVQHGGIWVSPHLRFWLLSVQLHRPIRADFVDAEHSAWV